MGQCHLTLVSVGFTKVVPLKILAIISSLKRLKTNLLDLIRKKTLERVNLRDIKLSFQKITEKNKIKLKLKKLKL